MNEDRLKIFNELNSQTLVDNRDDICTPIECVVTMLNYIPQEFWKRKAHKILDPCAGYGNFSFVCETYTNPKNI